MEIYQRNLELEQEIKEKTEEINQANKTMLTMGNIWDMMNSSEPLSNVLQNIVTSLQGDLKYLAALIIKKEEDLDGKYFQIGSLSENKIVKNILENSTLDLEKYRIPYIEDFTFAKVLKTHKINHSNNIKNIIRALLTNLSYDYVQDIMRQVSAKTVTVVPLYKKSADERPAADFGCLLVFSEREDASDTEINFLTLFANQIELAITIAGLFEEVRKQAVTDPLTGLYNRRYFEENLEREAERALRLGQPFSIVALDLDHLKTINDTYGHQYGDIAITTISNVLKNKARSIDVPARIGGEEFDVLLPGIDSYGAMIAAERIRAAIEAVPIEKIGGVTASIGVATFLEHTQNISDLIEYADQAMYRAKINGRNQVQMTQIRKDENWQKIAINAFLDIIAKQRIQMPSSELADITSKLNSVLSSDTNAKEVIYSAVDIITQSYNTKYRSGSTKSKLLVAVKLAKKMNLPKEEIEKLKIAVLLYDIGNIMIPEEIFNKKGQLTEEEREIVKTHPLIAAREILKPISNVQDVIPIIEKHHENWDGTGYPGKVHGEEIPVASQIILLIDTFYALTQDRAYRPAYPLEKAIELIKQDIDKKWSRELVENFIPLVQRDDSE